MISDNVDRDALLRYLEFDAELSDVINKYEDLSWESLDMIRENLREESE